MLRRCVRCSIRLQSIFADLDERELQQVEGLMVGQTLAKRQILFAEGEPMHGFYLLKAGAVKLYKTSPSGREMILRITQPGEMLGLCALRGKENYGHTAEAMVDSDLCYFSTRKLDDLFTTNPVIARKMLGALTKEVSEAYERIYTLGTKDARQRLADLLISLAGDYGERTPEGVALKVLLSRGDLAELLGTTVETAIRLVSDFKRRGIIETREKRLLILNMEAIHHISSEEELA